MKTLVLGASLNESRYSNKAIRLLKQYGHEVIAVGRDKGVVAEIHIQNSFPENTHIDTITLYLNPGLQKAYYEDIWNARPRRIIFNPGTENPELEELARAAGIETVEGCTLVMLSIGSY